MARRLVRQMIMQVKVLLFLAPPLSLEPESPPVKKPGGESRRQMSRRQHKVSAMAHFGNDQVAPPFHSRPPSNRVKSHGTSPLPLIIAEDLGGEALETMTSKSLDAVHV